jgi:hypothetical protein
VTPFLAIDPGANAGWAAFSASGLLESCGLAREPYVLPQRLGGWPVLVIEEPHEGQTQARKRDVIMLASRMGQLIQLTGARSVVRVQPVQWKGNVPKRIMTKRITDRWMTAADRGVLAECSSGRHDVVDAIGIGIWWCHVQGVRQGQTLVR